MASDSPPEHATPSRATWLRDALRERYLDRFGRLAALRLGLLVLGVTSGVTCLGASLSLGDAFQALFDDLDRHVMETSDLIIESAVRPFVPAEIDTLQARLDSAHLAPELHTTGRLAELDGVDVDVIAIDLVGDPRVQRPGRLTPESLRRVVTPSLRFSPRLREVARVSDGDVVTLRIGGRSARFLVDPDPLPDVFTERGRGATVAMDLGHFFEDFDHEATIDRLVVTVTPTDVGLIRTTGDTTGVASTIDDVLRGAITHPIRVLARGTASETALGWTSAWRAAASVLVMLGYLGGVVLFALSVSAALARRGRERATAGTADLENRETLMFAFDVVELLPFVMIATLTGLAYGGALADLIVRWRLPIEVWEAIAPARPERVPIAPVLAALVAGTLVPVTWAFVSHLDAVARPARGLLDVPRAPAAMAGCLLVLASLCVMPIGLGGPLAYVAGLSIAVALALLARPLIAIGARATQRIVAARAPLTARMLLAPITDSPTTTTLSWAMVVAVAVVLSVSWTLISALESRQSDWLATTFGADLVIEADRGVAVAEDSVGAGVDARVVDAGAAPALPMSVVESLSARPEIVRAAVVQRVAATVNGATIPLDAVSPSLITRQWDLDTATPWGDAIDGTTLDRVYMPADLAREFGLVGGDPFRLDSATGSWPAYLAGTFRPRPGEAPVALVDVETARASSAALSHASVVELVFAPGVDPRAARDAVSGVLGNAPVRHRVLSDGRPFMIRAAAVASGTLTSLWVVLVALAIATVLTLGPGFVFDAPATWIVLIALGVRRSRIARSAVLGTLLGTGSAVCTGLVGGWLAGAALVHAVAPSALGLSVWSIEAMPAILAAAVAWVGLVVAAAGLSATALGVFGARVGGARS